MDCAQLSVHEGREAFKFPIGKHRTESVGLRGDVHTGSVATEAVKLDPAPEPVVDVLLNAATTAVKIETIVANIREKVRVAAA